MRKYYSLEQTDKTADIYIFGDITSWEWMESDVSSYTLAKALQELNVDTINCYINSYGGEVAEGLAIYNQLKRHKAKVTTYCEGFACSAASIIFAAGNERVMEESSLLLIHNAWTNSCGDANQLRKEADDLEKITEQSIKAYMKVATITEEEIRAMMDKEEWIGPEEAVEYGLATKVEKEEKEENANQSARKKVIKMLLTATCDDEEKTEENPDTEDETEETDTEDDSEETDTEDDSEEDTEDDSENETDTKDDSEETEDEPEKDDKNSATQSWMRFFNAITK